MAGYGVVLDKTDVALVLALGTRPVRRGDLLPKAKRAKAWQTLVGTDFVRRRVMVVNQCLSIIE
jgi:hypothetical protein